MFKHGTKSKEFFKRAMEVTPYGVSSNYRFYGEEETVVVADAKGGYIFDHDGNRFIDYRLGWGPVLIGHGNEFVNNRVKEAIDHGVSFAGTQKYEVNVCERIIDLCPGVGAQLGRTWAATHLAGGSSLGCAKLTKRLKRAFNPKLLGFSNRYLNWRACVPQ